MRRVGFKGLRSKVEELKPHRVSLIFNSQLTSSRQPIINYKL